MDPAPAERGDDLLAELANEDRPLADFGEGFDHADDVALRDGRLEAQQQVGRGQVEEVKRVRLQHLAVVHQPPQLCGRDGHLVDAGDEVHRLGRAEVVADRTDAAEALHDDRDFPVHPALDEALEPAELDDVEAGLFDLAGFVQPDRHLAVAFDAGDRLDRDAAKVFGMDGGFEGGHRGVSRQS